MREHKKNLKSDKDIKDIFVKIDLHKSIWHVTFRTENSELFNGSIPGTWDALRRMLDRYKGHRIHAVYDTGYFGFWLYDRLTEYGAECILMPPSLLIPGR